MSVEHADPKTTFRAEQPLAGVSAYVSAKMPNLDSVPHFGTLRAHNILSGIDLVFYYRGTTLEYDFVAQPGAAKVARDIRLRFTGASNTRLQDNGDLMIDVPGGGQLRHRAPHAFAAVGGDRSKVASRYVLRPQAPDTVAIETGAYEPTAELTIDPVITYSTYLSGPTRDAVIETATDAAGSLYVLGETARTGYLQSLPPLNSLPYGLRINNDYGREPFLAKYSFDGNGVGTLEYLTYVNGSSFDRALGVAVTAGGVAYIGGTTASADLPLVKALQGPTDGVRNNPLVYAADVPQGTTLYLDGFILGLSFNSATRTLSIPFSTYLTGTVPPGRTQTSVDDIAVGASGSIYVVGTFYGLQYVNPTDTCCGNQLLQLKQTTAIGNPWEVVFSTVLGSNAVSVGVDSNEDVYTVAYAPANQGLEVTKYRPSSFQRLARSSFATNAASPAATTVDSSGVVYAVQSPFGLNPVPQLRRYAVSGSGFSETIATLTGNVFISLGVRLATDTNRDVYVGASAFATGGTVTPIPGVGDVDTNSTAGAVVFKYLTSGGTSLNLGTTVVLGHGSVQGLSTGPGDAVFVSGTPILTQPVPRVNSTASAPLLDEDIFVTRLAFSQSQAGAAILRVTKSGRGTVTSAGGQINCGATCSTSAAGTVVLTATADAGWVFKNWVGACTGNGGCSVAVDSVKGVTAVFERRFGVTVVKTGGGSGVVTFDTGETCGGTCTVTRALNTSVNMSAVADPGSVFVGWSAYCGGSTCGFSVTQESAVTAVFKTIQNPSPTGWKFVPVEPCRIFDSRTELPRIIALDTRNVPVRGRCNIPDEATAFALNLTVVPLPTLGYITMWPTGQPRPNVSTLNSLDGRIKANFAIVNAGDGGAVSLFANNDTHAILDVSGYFVPLDSAVSGAMFYPITPCRIIDTRNANGFLGGPRLSALQTRVIPARLSECGIPESAVSYSVNATVIPATTLGYLTLWPSGSNLPTVSTLNAVTGTIVANAAIIRGSSGLGHLSAFVTNDTDLIVDINGYFAPGTAPGGLFYYPVAPCRVADTRNATGPFGGPIQNGEREYPIRASGCGVPSTAQAYAVNTTVIPQGVLGYLTIWPSGQARPTVSTLNAVDGALTSNAAILPAGSNGSVATFMNGTAHLLLDLSGYFAP